MRRRAVFLLAVGLAGCERGCLTRWLAERGPSTDPAAPGLDLSGTDCSDGLLRCHGGVVEASRVAHLPETCSRGPVPEKTSAACTCPWDPVETCALGCADESVEATATSRAVAAQLCRPSSPVARPVLPEDDAGVEVCAEEGISCRESILRACAGGAEVARLVARCLFGCAKGISLEGAGDGPKKDPSGVVSILCQRSDAERP